MRSADLVSAPAAQQLVSVILPVFNEEERLAETITAVRETLELDLPAYGYEIVIVDDASTDRSSIIGKYLAHLSPSVRCVRREHNGGADEAIRTGVASASGDVVIVLDADLSYTPSIVRELVEPVLSGNVDIALASAYAKGGAVRNVPNARAFLSKWANRFLTFATLSRVRTHTCIVRAYSADVARELYKKEGRSVHGVLFEAIRRGYTIIEIPATLEWPGNRKSRMRLIATAQRTSDVLWSGIRFRLECASHSTSTKKKDRKLS